MKNKFFKYFINYLVFLLLGFISNLFGAINESCSWKFIFEGIEYRSSKVNKSKCELIHQIRINLQSSTATFFITPPYDIQNNYILSETTSNFLKNYNLQIAINGQAFGPPKQLQPNLPKKVCGFAIAEGLQYGRRCKEQSMFVVFKNGTIDIISIDDYPVLKDSIEMAMSGWTHVGHPDTLLEESTVNSYFFKKNIPKNKRKARTAIGISSDKQFLYLVVAEQTKKGLTLLELAKFMQKLGCDKAMNLDGGSSSTMVISKNGMPFIANALKKNFERPVANHLGIYAKELNSDK